MLLFSPYSQHPFPEKVRGPLSTSAMTPTFLPNSSAHPFQASYGEVSLGQRLPRSHRFLTQFFSPTPLLYESEKRKELSQTTDLPQKGCDFLRPTAQTTLVNGVFFGRKSELVASLAAAYGECEDLPGFDGEHEVRICENSLFVFIVEVKIPVAYLVFPAFSTPLGRPHRG